MLKIIEALVILIIGYAGGFFTLWLMAMPDLRRQQKQLEALNFVWLNGRYVQMGDSALSTHSHPNE